MYMNTIYLLIGLLILNILAPLMFDFFDVPMRTYLNYVLWINVLVVFYLLIG
jgi:hypothetical protein